jgi:hypothetical protein
MMQRDREKMNQNQKMQEKWTYELGAEVKKWK